MTQEIEVKARDMGWRPKDEYSGDPEKWIDAETYVERGETVLPIVRAQKAKLEKEVAQLRREVEETRQAMASSAESIQALETFYTEETKRQVAKAREDLKARIREARTQGEIEEELELQGELTKLNAAEAGAAKREEKPTPAEAKPQPPTPEYLAWQEENPWFLEDKKRARRAILIASELREDEPGLKGNAFYRRLDELLRSEGIVEAKGGAASKVEGGGDGDVRVSTGKSYRDLPADAKAACDQQGERLVGPSKKWKTQADWRKYYAEVYFREY
jgi:hypothetical protein